MKDAIADQNNVVKAVPVETVDAGSIAPEPNLQKTLSTLQDDHQSEFTSDNEIIADWLYAKSESTRKTYWSIIKTFFEETGVSSLSAITKKLILSYIEFCKSRNFKASTINKKISCIKSLLKHCVSEEYLVKNVAVNIKTLTQDKFDKTIKEASERIISREEIQKLLDVAKESNLRDYLILLVGYSRGLRVHEVSNLHWDDFTFTEKGARVKVIGKNAKVGFVNFPNKLVQQLKQLNTNDYIFKSNQNRQITRQQLHNIVKKYAKKVGLSEQISFHWLRHSCASHLANSNLPLSQVRDLLRHSSLAVTSQYVHSEEDNTFEKLGF